MASIEGINDDLVRPLTKRRKAVHPQQQKTEEGQKSNPMRKQVAEVEGIIRDLYISGMRPEKIADMINKFNLAANVAGPKWTPMMIEKIIKALILI